MKFMRLVLQIKFQLFLMRTSYESFLHSRQDKQINIRAGNTGQDKTTTHKKQKQQPRVESILKKNIYCNRKTLKICKHDENLVLALKSQIVSVCHKLMMLNHGTYNAKMPWHSTWGLIYRLRLYGTTYKNLGGTWRVNDEEEVHRPWCSTWPFARWWLRRK